MEAHDTVWERECAVAVLAGRHICPQHRMPCWVCRLLDTIVGTLRVVVIGGQFDFGHRSMFAWTEDTNDHFMRTTCPHYRASVAGWIAGQRLHDAFEET